MPFKSKAQRKWLMENKPEVARKFAQEEKWDNISESLPERIAPNGYWKSKRTRNKSQLF
jgi:hypothetical protein